MQDETQIPGAAAQELNNVPDPGATASPGGSEGLGQGFSGEDPTAIPTPTIQGVSGVSAFEPAGIPRVHMRGEDGRPHIG
jgi:hypothetical protein